MEEGGENIYYIFFVGETGSRGGGRDTGPMRGLEIYHVISRPRICLKINLTQKGQTYKHTHIQSLQLYD